jgi:antirestriction protein
MSNEIRIYAACLAAYNNGILHGTWIDCTGKVADDIGEEVQAMLAASPIDAAEEWAIHDFECPSQLRGHFSEYMGLDKVATMASLGELIEQGDHYAAGVALALDRISGTWDAADVESWIDEHYAGESSFGPAGWCEDWLEETGGLEGMPENLRSYFDYESYARDTAINGEVDFVDDDGEPVPHDSSTQCFAFYAH